MKGKRFSTEEKVRILREVDGGKSIVDICREKNISDVTFHRWKREFGQMDLNEAKRLKELERENTELKKMLVSGFTFSSHPLCRSGWVNVYTPDAGCPSLAEGRPGSAGLTGARDGFKLAA